MIPLPKGNKVWHANKPNFDILKNYETDMCLSVSCTKEAALCSAKDRIDRVNVFCLEIGEGVRGLAINNDSDYENEKEILLCRHLRFEAKEQDGTYYIVTSNN